MPPADLHQKKTYRINFERENGKKKKIPDGGMGKNEEKL